MLDIDWSQLNKVQRDKFDRVNGIFAVNKPKGMTSHDVVDVFRKSLGTRKVGHAGALDPFAEGLLLILVGKFTKKADYLINLDKSYFTKVLLGYGTPTHDIDSEVHFNDENFKLDNEKLIQVIDKLNQEYHQYVPVYSSVKIQGLKLREIARESESFEIITEENLRKAIFNLKESARGKMKNLSQDGILQVQLPFREVSVNIKLESVENVIPSKLEIPTLQDINDKTTSLSLNVDCTKGTYIRQLAFDIGQLLGSQGVLYKLVRTRIGEVTIDKAMELTDLKPIS